MSDVIENLKENIEEAIEKVEEKVEDIFGGDEKPKKAMKKSAKKNLEKEAEAESVDTIDSDAAKKKEETKSVEERKKELLEKAAKLKAKVAGEAVSSEDLKEQVKAKKRADMLVPLDEYVKAGIYLGTKVVTPSMKPFVYRRRADGLAIFNTDTIDEKLKEGIEYLSKFDAKDVILVCKRQAGWKAAEKFSELTGIRVFTKKYPAGILTNIQLPDFFENELTIVTDQWIDKNALNDTLKAHKKVLMICDTNNFAKGADCVMIGNNKSGKSLGLIFYLLARGFCKARNIDADIPDLEWWTEGEE